MLVVCLGVLVFSAWLLLCAPGMTWLLRGYCILFSFYLSLTWNLRRNLLSNFEALRRGCCRSTEIFLGWSGDYIAVRVVIELCELNSSHGHWTQSQIVHSTGQYMGGQFSVWTYSTWAESLLLSRSGRVAGAMPVLMLVDGRWLCEWPLGFLGGGRRVIKELMWPYARRVKSKRQWTTVVQTFISISFIFVSSCAVVLMTVRVFSISAAFLFRSSVISRSIWGGWALMGVFSVAVVSKANLGKWKGVS